jgi:membrane-associated protein
MHYFNPIAIVPEIVAALPKIELTEIIPRIGYAGVWSIVFAESGLLFGFFLPGDSLLFTTGFLCSIDKYGFNIGTMAFGCFAAAVLGDNVGYWTGHKYGRKLFQKENSRFFKKEHLVAAQDFYERKGPMAIVLARFLPFVRTFAPIVAGIASMRQRTFITYNLVGGIVWAIGLNLVGYYLGALIAKTVGQDQFEKYLIFITIGVVFLSFVPTIIHYLKSRKHS